MTGQLLHFIVRWLHCHDTHHRLAMDALPLVRTPAGQRLVRLLLRYHHSYLTGATDPDTRFCDFQNHVIHTRDGYWGGTPRVAHAWYDRLQRYLGSARYSDAAHAAGVLSHYLFDSLHPLHTHHDAVEKVMHGPIDWSIERGYRSIRSGYRQTDMQVVFQLSDRPGWLGEAILHAARFANSKYEVLLEGYDASLTLDAPSDALSGEARAALAELLGLSITGWARILERVAADAEEASGSALPRFSTNFAIATAILRGPIRWGSGRLQRYRHQIEVAQLLEEWWRTGDVTEHLPAEVDIVHRVVQVRQDEKRWKQARVRRLSSQRTRVGTSATTTIPFPNLSMPTTPPQHQRRAA